MGVYRFSLPVRLSLLHIRHFAQSESSLVLAGHVYKETTVS